MTYVYCCPKCDKTFEAEQSIKAEPLKNCCVCRGPIHRVPQKPAIAFQAKGFYCVDTPGAKKPV